VSCRPGGRIFKGETFFVAAERKLKEETGLTSSVPTTVLGFYNTLFPTRCVHQKHNAAYNLDGVEKQHSCFI
jgi:8-oxo-dGTP pyrophosphatase MutT (NUDIX family)